MSDVRDLFQREKIAWLDSARAVAIKLLQVRKKITVEDVLKECPRPTYIHRNTTGSIFKSPDFVASGWTASKRPAMNSRYVRQWSLSK